LASIIFANSGGKGRRWFPYLAASVSVLAAILIDCLDAVSIGHIVVVASLASWLG
jgi:hypothetical protein